VTGTSQAAVLLYASHSIFIQAIFDQLTVGARFTPYIIGEFGAGLALTRVVIAYVFWRMERNHQVGQNMKSLQDQPS
jgi:uncharacterized protein